MTSSWPNIKKKTNPGGSTTWMVDCGMIGEKRTRYFFKTKQEAETKAAQLRISKKNDGLDAFSIPASLRLEALQCAEMLKPFGKSLTEAVKFYIPYIQAESRTILIQPLMDEFLAAKLADGASPRYLQDLRSKLSIFSRAFVQRTVASITGREMDDWLRNLKSPDGRPAAPISRNNFRRVLAVLFNYAKNRQYCLTSPLESTAKAKEIENPVGILTVDELSRLLLNAPVEIIAFIALGAFAGLRRSELERLDWMDIDLQGMLISIPAHKAKSARRRIVKIRGNLARWLRASVRSGGPVTPNQYRELLDRARQCAGIHEWPSNALRHSFASYCLAFENNAPALALEMGHSNTQLVFQHYREVVKPKDAEAYWKLTPPI